MKNRIYWLSKDNRKQLEQITFDEDIQHYIAPDRVNNTDVLSVLAYIDVTDLNPRQADFLAKKVAEFPQPGVTIAAYNLGLKKVVVHNYIKDRDTILENMQDIQTVYRLIKTFAQLNIKSLDN